MFSKLRIIVLAAWLSLTCPLSGRILTVDRIAAVVNNEIITLSDIDRALLIYPFFRAPHESERDFYLRVLEDLIHYKVAWLEYREEIQLTAEDYNPLQTAIIRKAGSLQKVILLLERFDMTREDLKPFIRERVMYEKVLKDNFQMKITIPFTEIEEFYRQQYLPVQRSLNLPARSLVDMAPMIEKHLRTLQTENRVSGWLDEIKISYRVENRLASEAP
ncbi:MAG TPA: hypothetical protein ENN40_05640 [Candidatus Aminicenantes bacterium]|nr:hypothetical protein [Candidatus Aminicenantes bacterium]